MLVLLYCILFNELFALIGSYSLFNFNSNINYYYNLCFIAFLSVFIQFIVFLHASGLIFGNERTEKYFDLTGSCTYISLIIISIIIRGGISVMSTRQLILSGLVIIWAIRLGSFLFSRIQRHGGIDNRFTAIKPDFNRFCRAWGLQGVWVFLTAFPVFLINDHHDQGPSELTTRDYIGLTIWFIGFSFECLADYQKSIWKQKNTFINTGLWSISRHPNYFGEITLWIGVFITASTSFTHITQWITIISPIFVSLLLIYVSGIPLLEKLANEKYKDKQYKLYKERVPVLIPFIGRKGDAKF